MAKSRPRFSLPVRTAQLLEAACLWALFHIVRALPLDAASAIGGWFGAIFGPFLPRTAIARRNLQRAFPEKSQTDVETIVRGMWENLGRVAFEFPHLERFHPSTVNGRIELVGAEHLGSMRIDNRSSFMFSGHFANWELLGPAAAALGIQLNMFYRAPNNPYLGWLYDARRIGIGEMLPKGKEGAKQTLRLVKKGAKFAMLVDQKLNNGIAVQFFGHDAMTAPALATLALRFNCPVLPTRIERLNGARFRITILPPMTFTRTLDHHADVSAAMRQVNAILEDWIIARPEQWLWLHHRWPKTNRRIKNPTPANS